MLVQSDRSHRVQQILEQVTVGALYVYAVCSVISISAMQAAYIFALVTWAARVYLQGHTRQLYLPLLIPFGAFALASGLATARARSAPPGSTGRQNSCPKHTQLA